MRIITAFCFMLVWLPTTAKANVYEFNFDGSVIIHSAEGRSIEERPSIETPPVLPQPTRKFEAIVDQASMTYGVPIALIHAVISQESAYDPNALSPKGAMGLMQLMPQTAKHFDVENAFDPEENIMAGTRYLSELLHKYNHNIARALAAYNAGEGAVSKYDGIPPYPETQNYVYKIMLKME